MSYQLSTILPTISTLQSNFILIPYYFHHSDTCPFPFLILHAYLSWTLTKTPYLFLFPSLTHILSQFLFLSLHYYPVADPISDSITKLIPYPLLVSFLIDISNPCLTQTVSLFLSLSETLSSPLLLYFPYFFRIHIRIYR